MRVLGQVGNLEIRRGAELSAAPLQDKNIRLVGRVDRERKVRNIRGLGGHLERELQGLVSSFQDQKEGVRGFDAQAQDVFAFRNRLISHHDVKPGLYRSN